MVSEIARKNKNAAPASLYDETTLRNHRNADNQRRDDACFGAAAINHRGNRDPKIPGHVRKDSRSYELAGGKAENTQHQWQNVQRHKCSDLSRAPTKWLDANRFRLAAFGVYDNKLSISAK